MKYNNKFARQSSPTSILEIVVILLVLLPTVLPAQQDSVQAQIPWMDIPASWSRVPGDNILTLVPDDLPADAVLFFMVELPAPNQQSLESAYQQALSDLGPWRPVGQVLEQAGNNNWHFRFGIGVAQLEGSSFTALTAVASRGDLLARFWVLASSDAIYNQYQETVLRAISSVQDISSSSLSPASSSASAKLDPAFGQGISGVYLGLERGLHAGAAGNYIGDEDEIDVFYPDHTYRRRLPIRGLMSDAVWDRQHQAPLWGSWQQEGDGVTVIRGGYQSRYTLRNGQLVDDRDRVWAKVNLPGVKRIDGVYARIDFNDADAPRLVLRADGTYEDRGRFLRMVTSPWHLVEPDGDTMVSKLSESAYEQLERSSVGTYTFENYTLTFHTSDGRIWQVNAFVHSDESFPQVKRLEINGVKLRRD